MRINCVISVLSTDGYRYLMLIIFLFCFAFVLHKFLNHMNSFFINVFIKNIEIKVNYILYERRNIMNNKNKLCLHINIINTQYK
jgi:hypothetical protein